jgi:hypothetical protein
MNVIVLSFFAEQINLAYVRMIKNQDIELNISISFGNNRITAAVIKTHSGFEKPSTGTAPA